MYQRRELLKLGAGLLAAASISEGLQAAGNNENTVILKTIPGSGQTIPAIGMGTSRTFDVSAGTPEVEQLAQVMQAFFQGGGQVIDSSPMYGKAESRVGDLLRGLDPRPPVFAATKVWTNGRESGIGQMTESARRMDVQRFDLIAVHNLRDWRTQLDTLKQWKQQGILRYIGITTSHGRDHAELLDIMRDEPLDFVQFTYNIEDRQAEQHLLPLALDKGIATMINRPYQRGSLFSRSSGQDLPEVAKDIGCTSWGQFYLKFIIGHPAVTCVIPATSKAHHMEDNMQANVGRLPDAAQREEMLRAFNAL